MNNIGKGEVYAKYKQSLKKSLDYEFWLQAIFVEYAIIEDRTESVLLHAGNIKMFNKRGKPLKLEEKLNKISSNEPFTDKSIRKYLSLDLIEKIRVWKDKRNLIIHGLMNNVFEDDYIKITACEGNELVKILDSKVRSANNIIEKRKANNVSI